MKARLCILIAVSVLTLTSGQTFTCLEEEEGVVCEPDCNSYFVCSAGFWNHVQCPINEVFNFYSEECRPSDSAPPPCGTYTACDMIPDYRIPILEDECRSYKTCSNGADYGDFDCEEGLVFDIEHQTCNWPYDTMVPCGTRIQPADPSRCPRP